MEPDVNPGMEDDAVDVLASHQDHLIKMFDELSFREKWKRVTLGLKLPATSGQHKWARLQMIRLLSPFLALLIPILILFLIAFLAKFAPKPTESFQVTVVDPTPMEELEEIEPPIPEKLEPPDPVDMQVDVATDAPSLPTDVITPPAETASVQPAEFDSVAQVKSPVVLTGIMGSRNPGTRGAALGRYGGGGHTEEAVLRALRWLAKNQHADGSWGKAKPAMASLALLAYLAHGDTPATEEFGQTVEKAIRFLVDAQESNGHFRGRDKHDYTQPIAAYALAEAYGMTKVPMLKTAAIRAIEVVAKGQNASGSFNYNLKPSDRDDLSYAAWCVQALKAASIAGLQQDVPEIKTAMERAIAGVKGHFSSRGESTGLFGYARGGGRAPGLTGAGVLSLQFLGDGQSREAKMGIAGGMEDYAFNWQEPPAGSPVYYWYYNTQAYFQEGGAIWDRWNTQFSKPLVSVQNIIPKAESGYLDHKGVPHDIGFWVSPAVREHTGGNGEVMDTILCALMLEVYYRYLPTFQQIPAEEIQEELGDEDDLVIEIVQTRPQTIDLPSAPLLAMPP